MAHCLIGLNIYIYIIYSNDHKVHNKLTTNIYLNFIFETKKSLSRDENTMYTETVGFYQFYKNKIQKNVGLHVIVVFEMLEYSSIDL